MLARRTGLLLVGILSSACGASGGSLTGGSGEDGQLLPDCAPVGERMEHIGRVELAEPDPERNGKQFLGARLVDAEGRSWILTYSRTSVPRALNDRQVRVRGRACSPRYQSVAGEHFKIESLDVLP